MTNNPPRVAVATPARYRFPTALVWWTRCAALGERTVAPLADLAVRLLLAQGFLISGVLKLSDWNTRALGIALAAKGARPTLRGGRRKRGPGTRLGEWLVRRWELLL